MKRLVYALAAVALLAVMTVAISIKPLAACANSWNGAGCGLGIETCLPVM